MSIARTYSGTLGLLAFVAAVLHSVVHGANLDSAVPFGLGALAVGALVGWVAGAIADRTVVEGVRQRMLQQLQASNAPAERRGQTT